MGKKEKFCIEKKNFVQTKIYFGPNYIGKGNKKVFHLRDHTYIPSAKRWVGGVRKIVIFADFQYIHAIYADVTYAMDGPYEKS